ncbi:hypothetical protein Tco_0726712 [Tanacetum coccineum]|uniref:Retrotransposon gag domain-containing protein n=1 Tax=Tanacetum coccineum TaxID=301880 RepID=A0ABQ4YIL2_9ASTR
MSVRAQKPISLPTDTEVAICVAIPTLPPSPHSPLSSPLPPILLPLPQILSPPLLVSSPPLPASPTYPLGYKADMIWLRPRPHLTSIYLPSSTPTIRDTTLLPIPFTYSITYLPSIPPPCFFPLLAVGESSSAPTARPTGGFKADYGFAGTLDDEIRQDIDEIYVRPDDAQDERLLMSGQLKMLGRDRRAHARTARLIETKARLSHEAWVQSMDASDTTRYETDEYTADTENGTKKNHQINTTPTTYVTDEQLKRLIDQGVTDALAARDAKRSQNGKDSHDLGTSVRRQAPPARECTYPDFMKCKPLYFKGTEGVIELTQWFERMETVFHISNCSVENQIKFATCTLLGSALTWWNSHVKTVGHDELPLMCARLFPEESDKNEKYVNGLPDMIHGSVMESNPKTMQDAIEFATELMDKKIHTFAE